MRLITANNENKEVVLDFLQDQMDFDPGGDYAAMAVIDRSNEIVGGIVYHNFDEQARAIEISAAGTTPRWLSKRVLNGMYQYPFDQLGCQIVYQQNAESNSGVSRILRRLGFNEYKIPRIRGINDALMIFTLTKEQWKEGFGHGKRQIESTIAA